MMNFGTTSSLVITGGLGLVGDEAGAVTEGLGVTLAQEHSDIYSDGEGGLTRAAVWETVALGGWVPGFYRLDSSNEVIRSTDTPKTTKKAGLNI